MSKLEKKIREYLTDNQLEGRDLWIAEKAANHFARWVGEDILLAIDNKINDITRGNTTLENSEVEKIICEVCGIEPLCKVRA